MIKYIRPNILKYTGNTESIFVLHNAIFPYPPFTHFKLTNKNKDHNISIIDKREAPYDLQAGGSVKEEKFISFKTSGKFHIELIELKYDDENNLRYDLEFFIEE